MVQIERLRPRPGRKWPYGKSDKSAPGRVDPGSCRLGDGMVNGTDSTFITRTALDLFAPLFNLPGN
jgi:hypothetical protein